MSKAGLDLETEIKRRTGLHEIAGLDEAGRGALAGPVTAAAVILPLDQPPRLAALAGVHDSKQLTARQRLKFYDLIIEHAVAWGIASTPATAIDSMGILPATRQSMSAAIAQLQPPARYLLIDGRIRLRQVPLRQQSIIRGDARSLSIAAASILAKVTRDKFMIKLADTYPQYGFERHKGYGTAMHMKAITQHGPSPLHRLSFAPLREKLL